MTVVNATFEGVNGFSDDSVVLFRSPRLRGSGDSEVIVTRKSIRVKPEDGEISVDLDPGLVEVAISGGSYLISVPTSGPVNLWDLIAAAIPFPEGTPSEAVGAAVSAHMKLYPGEVALSAVETAIDEKLPDVMTDAAAELISTKNLTLVDAAGGQKQFQLEDVLIGDPFDIDLLAVENIVGRYEPEALDLFDRMTVRPDFDRRHAINQLIKDLKDYNLWDRLDGLYMFAAHTSQAALLNWRRTSANMAAINSPTFTADLGFKGDGVSSSLWNTSAATVKTQGSNAAITLWVPVPPSVKSTVFDLWWTNWGYGFDVARTSTSIGYQAVGATRALVSYDQGFYGIVRPSTSASYVYRDGALIDTNPNAYDTTGLNFNPASPIRLLSQNGSSNFTDSTVSFMSYGASMSQAEMALFYNAVNDYMTAVDMFGLIP